MIELDLIDAVIMTFLIMVAVGMSAASAMLAYEGGPLIGVTVLLFVGLWATGVTGILIGSVMSEEDR